MALASIAASHRLNQSGNADMEIDPDHEAETSDALPQNAVLILEGLKAYPLREALINIGRKLENHIIIDDPRISRVHAQLRAIKGHFVLFDLGSKGGTFVNGQRISEVMLYSGDVISLAGVTLIFAQDSPIPPMETSPLGEAGANQHSTPTMEKTTIDTQAIDMNPEGGEVPPKPPQ
jgi:pSer/pThr/pTyr-binding forkhead associated (FHA) protein